MTISYGVLGHFDQLILFIVGHFDQLRAVAPPCPVYLILRFCAEGTHPLAVLPPLPAPSILSFDVVTSSPCPVYLIL